jgi:uncharacterized protein
MGIRLANVLDPTPEPRQPAPSDVPVEPDGPRAPRRAGTTAPTWDSEPDPDLGHGSIRPTPSQTTNPELRPLDPRVKRRWWVGGALTLLQILVPVTVLDFLIPHPLPSGRIALVVLTVGALLVAVLPLVRYRRWRYALREEDLWIRFGLLTVTVSVIPYRRLQFVDTRSGPIDRLFKLSELVVHTAALGTSGRLPGLDAAEAERLREVLSHIAPDDDAV